MCACVCVRARAHARARAYVCRRVSARTSSDPEATPAMSAGREVMNKLNIYNKYIYIYIYLSIYIYIYVYIHAPRQIRRPPCPP